MAEHRKGIDPGFLITHKLALTGLAPGDASVLYRELEELPGVDAVSVDESGQSVKIAYDASHQDIDHIIRVIEQQGAGVRSDWWNRIKLSWQRQTDRNIKDNFTHEAQCCSKMPTGHKTPKKK